MRSRLTVSRSCCPDGATTVDSTSNHVWVLQNDGLGVNDPWISGGGGFGVVQAFRYGSAVLTGTSIWEAMGVLFAVPVDTYTTVQATFQVGVSSPNQHQSDYDIFAVDNIHLPNVDVADLGASITWNESGADWSTAGTRQTPNIASIVNTAVNAGGYTGNLWIVVRPTTLSVGALDLLTYEARDFETTTNHDLDLTP